jgi:hypothetical protein
MRRLEAAFLSSGTSPERIAPESLTPSQCGFVHRNISGRDLMTALDQVCRGPTRQGLGPKSLKLKPAGSRIRSGEESTEILSRHSGMVRKRQCAPLPPRAKRVAGRGWGWGAVQQPRYQRHARRDPPPPTPPHRFAGGGEKKKSCSSFRGDAKHRTRNLEIPGMVLAHHPGMTMCAPHCVFATRGGVACVMNSVACSIAVPSGVGITIRNGTRMRVPATGAKAISMLRWAVRYLITARSGI